MICDSSLGDWAAVATAIITFFILLKLKEHARIFGEQAGHLKSSVDAFVASDTESRKSRQQELRAYVYPRVDPLGICNVATLTLEEERLYGLNPKQLPAAYQTNPQNGPHLHLSFFNTGKTPAYDSRIFADMKFLDFGNSDDNGRAALLQSQLDVDALISERVNNTGRDVISPDGSTPYIVTRMPNSALDAIQLGILRHSDGEKDDGIKGAIYVFGSIIYRDAFEIWWRYDFRMAHFKMFKEPIGINGMMHLSKSGNKEEKINPQKPPKWWNAFMA